MKIAWQVAASSPDGCQFIYNSHAIQILGSALRLPSKKKKTKQKQEGEKS